jgi:hypothetical protein
MKFSNYPYANKATAPVDHAAKGRAMADKAFKKIPALKKKGK